MLRVLLETEVFKNVKKKIYVRTSAINKGNADYMEEMDVIVYTMR